MENRSIINTTHCIDDIISKRSYVVRCLDRVVERMTALNEDLLVAWNAEAPTRFDAAQVAELRSRLAADDACWRDFLPADAHVTPETLAAALPLGVSRMFASGATSIHGQLLLPVDRFVLSSDPERQRTLVRHLVNRGRLFVGDLLDNVDLRGSRLPPSYRDAVAAAMSPYAGAGLSLPVPCESVKGWLAAWVLSARPMLSELRRIRLSDTPLSTRTRNALTGVSWRHKCPGTARSDINDLAALVLDDMSPLPDLGEKGEREIRTFLSGIGLWRGMREEDFPVEADERETAAQSAAEPALKSSLTAMIVTREDSVRKALEAFLEDSDTVTVTYDNGDVLRVCMKALAEHALRDVPAFTAILAYPAPLSGELVRRCLVAAAHDLAAETGGEERDLSFDRRLLLPLAVIGLPKPLEKLLLEDENIVVGDLVYKLSHANLSSREFNDATDADDFAICQDKLQNLLGVALDARALKRAGWPITYQSKWPQFDDEFQI